MKNPFLLGLCVLFGLALLTTFPWLLILATAPAAWYGTQWYDRRYQAASARRRMLVARADYEHHALLHGDPRGTYGQYPPAQ